QAEDGIRDFHVTGVQTCALPIFDIAALNAVQAPTRIEATARDAIQKNYGDPDGLTAFEVTPGEFPTGAQLDEMLKLPVDQRRLRSEERRVGKEDRWWWWGHAHGE